MSTVTIFCRNGACNVENHTRDNCPNRAAATAPRILEATCGGCGSTFNPDSPTDLDHIECGSRGVLVGTYL